MSSLCDPQIGVRAHALNSLDEMVKSRSVSMQESRQNVNYDSTIQV